MNFEIVDHNIIPDQYVTYIVDVWQGDRKDPATRITRYIGTWRASDLETEEGEAFDPDFSFPDVPQYRIDRISMYEFDRKKSRPLVWDRLETVQEPDQDLLQHREAHDRLSEQNGHTPLSWRTASSGVGYEQFLQAIDAVAVNEDDEEAWATIDKWRQRQMPEAER